MVSFQCHACGDVVKKPKLDQHRMRCHSGYDCIDCSKTFNSPAEYKGHTSCISEAEKYQGSLYKGPKTGSATTNASKKVDTPKTQEEPKPAGSVRASNAQWNHVPTANGNGNDYQGGRGGYGGGYGPWARRSNLTGANETPLGASARSSPVTSAPSPVEKTASAAAPPQTNGAANGHKKDNKRKSAAATDDTLSTSNKKAKLSKEQPATVVEPAPAPGPSTEEVKKEKKSKKEKKDKDAGEVEKKKKGKGEDGDVEMAVPADEEEEGKKKKKKEKKRKEEAGEVEVNGEESKADKKKEKKHKEEAGDIETNGEESRADKKKKKKKGTSATEESASPTQEEEVVNGANTIQGEDKKKKREKKGKPSADAMDVDSTTPTVDLTKKKEKKHKKEKKTSSATTVS